MIRIRSSLPLFVALRYLRSSRRDAFITFLSLTAAGGMALGVAALILSAAALTGFQSVLRDEVLARTPQIEVTLPAGTDAPSTTAAISSVRGVSSVRPWLRGRGWLLSAGRSRPVEIHGYDGDLPRQFPHGSGEDTGLYVSDRMATSWGLEPGTVLEVISARPTLTPLGPQPRVLRLPLAGTYEAGRTEQEDRVALGLAEAIHLFGAEQQRLWVDTAGLDEAVRTAGRLGPVLPAGATVNTWRDFNRALLFLLRLEKSLMFVAVFLIVVVAAMAVISDLMLILAHKQAEMGMLGAMGADRRTFRRIFLWLGSLLVVVGAGLGSILGIVTAWLLDRYRVLALPGDVYFLDHVPFQVRPYEVGVILLATAALTLICSWFVAARAGDLRPVEALRR